MEKCSDPNCSKYATIYHPAPYCDRDWARRYSSQFSPEVAEELKLSNFSVPSKKFLEWQLNNRGLSRKPDESKDEHLQRCKKIAYKSKLLS